MSFRWTAATAWRPGGQASGGRSARPNTQYRYSRNLMTVATRLAARSTQISVSRPAWPRTASEPEVRASPRPNAISPLTWCLAAFDRR